MNAVKKPDWLEAIQSLKDRHERFHQENPDVPKTQYVCRDADAVLKAVGVGELIRLIFREKLQSTPAIQAVRDWVARESWCLVISGKRGVGKSVAAATWLVDWAQKQNPQNRFQRRWWTASEFGALSNYGKDVENVGNLDKLILDDLGTELYNSPFQTKLDQLIDARYRDSRRLIITTNLNHTDFAKRYKGRVYDRLRENGSWFNAIGESMRKGQK